MRNKILGRIFRLTYRAASGPGAWRGLGVYGVVLGLQFVGVWFSVRLISWTKDFYDALENMNAAAALAQIGVFALLTCASASTVLLGDWLRKRLLMVWRERLTARALDVWTANKAYWHLRPGLSPDAVDNPDQRVAEDCRLFVQRLLGETLDLISSVVALVSYLAILWSLSSFPLAFTLFGAEISIPRYMIWAAFIYVALSSLITHLLGRPIKGLIFTQERREADFRHALIQLREAATEVAQSGGEAAERRRLNSRFGAIKANWRRLIGAELVLGLFARPYMQTVLRIPIFLALPVYFAGAITFGGLMQMASAFSNVVTTLSWFIFSYRDLAEFVAVSERLDGLFTAAESPAPMPGTPRDIQRETSADGSLRLDGLQLFTPEGRALAPVPNLILQPGTRVWISGASGEGKTTLLAALSGLWPYGTGKIGLPADAMLFLPQLPHVFAEGIAAAACYPTDPMQIDPDLLRSSLIQLGLGHRLGAIDTPGQTEGLSMGERQRLALARVLINRPRWLVLDEATSALDATAEAEVLALIRRALPATTILCVAHRPPQALAPFDVLRIGAHLPSEWKIA